MSASRNRKTAPGTTGRKAAGAASGAAGQRLVRADLLREGLALLAEGGIDGLTIDALCGRLGVTKGSFYHHFAGRRDFLRGLLEFWVRDWTDALADRAACAASPQERFRNIVREAASVPAGPETAIRAWAERDAMARAFQERVDRLRLAHLESIFKEATGDARRARLLARIDYALFVGARAMAPPMDASERQEMVKLVTRELYGFPA